MNSREKGKRLNELVSGGDYDFNAAQKLIQEGADLEIADNRGLRVLHHAAVHNDFELIKLLLEQGAEVDAKDGWDNTPLKLATRERNYKDERIPQLFFNYSADDSQIETSTLRSRLRKTTSIPKSLQTPRSPSIPVEPSVGINKEEGQGTRMRSLGKHLMEHEQRKQQQFKEINQRNDRLNEIWKALEGIFSSQKVLIELRKALEDQKAQTGLQCGSSRDEKILQEIISRIQSNQFQVFHDGEALEKIADQEPEVFLYLALGYSTQIGDFFHDARASLEQYIFYLETGKTMFLPEFFLAQARVATAMNDLALAYYSFSLFCEYTVPEFQKRWILVDENYPKPKQSSSKKGSEKADPIRTKWEELKKKLKGDQKKIQPMEELLELIGLESVKEIALNIYAKILADQELPEAARVPVQLNFSFMGNPGTGKTTVARIFGRLIQASGAIKSNSDQEIFVTTTAQKLISAGAAKFEDTIKEAMGGVLFIDEAYALSPKQDKIGQSIVDQILTAAEDHRQELSIILAGYKNDIEDKIYGYNMGLKSRFRDVYFEDFDVDALRKIWDGMLKKYNPNNNGWRVESENVSKIGVLRVARGIGRKGFGNAREIRTLFERAINFAQVRGAGKPPVLKLVDIIGPEPSRENIPELDKALQDLEAQVGLGKVKKKIEQLIEAVAENYELEKQGKAPQPIALNRLFVGNPGTGKTTLAEIYGRILKSLRLLSDGGVEYKTASDFVGSVVGESQNTTSNILALCQGKVLVIDEAYNLNDNLYGKQVLDTIVEKVSGKPGEDIAIVMCGYEREMEEMFSNQNPGLKRRFNPEDKLIFEDFDNEALAIIMKRACNRQEIPISSGVIRKAVSELAKKRAMPHFGNAGAVLSMLSSAQIRRAARIREDRTSSKMMIEADLFSQEPPKNPFDILSELENVDSIRVQLEEMYKVLEVWKREGGEKPKIGNYRFVGNAGTGKTTIARLMGAIFYSMGILAREHVEETSGKGLTANVVGATKDIVEAKMQAAAGGILFVDEAYDLGKGIYGEEAQNTLLRLITDPRYNNDQTIVILAGYESDIEMMMLRNQGMNSRFPNTIYFEDWTPNSCASLLRKLASADKILLPESLFGQINQGFQILLSLPKWGNARDVKTLYEKLKRKRSLRVFSAPESAAQFTADDISQTFNDAIKERSKRIEIKIPQQDYIDAEVVATVENIQTKPIQLEQKQECEAKAAEKPQEQVEEQLEEDEELELRNQFKQIFEGLDSDILEKRGSLGEESLEGILESMNYVGPDSLDDILSGGLNNPKLKEAMQRLIDALIKRGMGLKEAKERVTRAVEDWLEAKREAKRLEEELRQKERAASRVAVFVCGACGRSWGICTYWGPQFSHYEYPDD